MERFLFLIATSLLFFAHFDAHALSLESTAYGEINVSYDIYDDIDNDWKSNASRLGIKGEYSLGEFTALIYQFEQEVDYAHGGTEEETLFAMRDSFIGIKGGFGTVFWGAHDTPFHKAQGNVDLFNDQIGDIRTLVASEIRTTDSLMYYSPSIGGHFSVQTMYIPSDNQFDASYSTSLIFQSGDWYGALAVDSDMRENNKTATITNVYSSTRAVVQYTSGNWKFGALFQQSEIENVPIAKKESGIILSTSYNLNNWDFLFQHGQSHIIQQNAESNQVGVNYHLSDQSKVYLYWVQFDNDVITTDTISLGVQLKF